MDGSLPEVEYVADFTLTGILENSYLGYATGMVDGIVGNGTAESVISGKYLLYSTDFKTHSKQNFQSIVCDLAADFEAPLKEAGFNKNESSFAALLGLCHYLSRDEFSALLGKANHLFPEGSDLVFDFPLKTAAAEPGKTEQLASGAGEKMKVRYDCRELEKLLSQNGFRIYEYLEAEDIECRFFDRHNLFTSGTGILSASGDFALCLAAKKE